MAIPKIDYPTYEIKLPSDNKTIVVRPFSVKEEKLLLMALEANNLDDVIKTVKQVINNCVITGDVNVDRLPFFDIDYLFIFLRAKSIGENVDVTLTCNNVLEDETVCGNVFPTKMDVTNIEIERPEGIDDDIKLTDVAGVKMKYPNYATMKRIEETDMDVKTNMIANAIDYIWDEQGKHSAKESSKEELIEFVESLTENNYKKLQDFVDNTPKFVVKLDAKCPKCGFDHKVRYSDFYDFFF
jgi:hypothetical protein